MSLTHRYIVMIVSSLSHVFRLLRLFIKRIVSIEDIIRSSSSEDFGFLKINKVLSVSHFCTLFGLVPLSIAHAQIQTDGSLGSAQKLNGPNYVIDEGLGKRAGNNLFHSFHEFNINKGESATFRGANEIANVVSRVTGGKRSTINGLLKSEIKNANVYLINSAGVLFGPNASLSINGSFHASTADYVRFNDDDLFYSEPLKGEVLSTAAPAAFGFFEVPQGNITVAGSQFSLENEATFSLVGAGVTIEGEANIQIPQGQINVLSVNSPGEAAFDTSGGYYDLNANTFIELNDVNILNNSKLNVDGEGGGRVVIRGGQMVLKETRISAQTTGSYAGKGIDIAAGHINFSKSQIDTTTAGSGAAGDVLVNASTLVLDGLHTPEEVGIFANSSYVGGRNIKQSTLNSGKAGKVRIVADKVDILGQLAIEAVALLPENNGTVDLLSQKLTLNGFDADFRVDSGKGEAVRLAGGSIILDGSLTPDLDGFALPGILNPDQDGVTIYAIEADWGEIAGKNLFYSFREFLVDENEIALFKQSEQTANVSNIITRITGNKLTSVYGEIKSEIPDANLYLINPNGIFLGPNAILNLPGSFHVGTADYLTLSGGGRFDVSDPAGSVLNSGELSAYGFTDNEIGAITMEGSRLKLTESRIFSLIGGNLWLEDAGLLAPFGHINLVSLQSAGEAFIVDESNDLDISHFSTFGDIILNNESLATVVQAANLGEPDGSLRVRLFVRGQDLRLDNNSGLRARNRTQKGAGGSVDVLLSGDLFIGKDSDISINGEGELGQMSIVADNIIIDGTRSGKFTGIDASHEGKAGAGENNLQIFVNQGLKIISGGVIDVANYGDLDGGKAKIESRDLIIDKQNSDEFTGIYSATSSGSGNGGILEVFVKEWLRIDNGGLINSTAYGSGDGGRAIIQAKNLIIDNQSGIYSGATPGSENVNLGNGGELDINIEEHLQILNGGTINVSAFDSGNGGSATIKAKNLTIDGQGSDFTGISSFAGSNFNSDGGTLYIEVTERVEIINGGGMTVSADRGNAGNVSILAGGDIRITDSFFELSAGQEDFDVNNPDNFSASVLSIEAGDSIYIKNSTLLTNAGASGSARGSGGDIYLSAPADIWLENSTLSAQAGYAGGNVYIDPIRYIVISSDVIAQADVRGGNYSVIVKKPSGWIQSTDSQINLSGQQSGSVLSNTSPFDLGAKLNDLDLEFVNLNNWVSQPCKFRQGGAGSSFVVTGWRGVSDNTDDFLPNAPMLLADYNVADIEVTDKKILQKAIFPDLKDECDDCP